MLREQVTEALKDAMRAGDKDSVSTLRMILAGIKDKDIAARPSGKTDGIGDPEILSLLQSMVKQRRESVALYRQGGRQDLVDKEEGEIAVVERFLPKQMTPAEVDAAIAAVIAETGAASIKDMRRVMSALKAKYSGQMDFSAAGPAVKAKLGG
ncbi:MAG TPA: GatB/YqeY domain-containing protein [Alphaproteobacteria bacterium]|nr:GatB/YqeY domain-containing protein [Alphaproteobacteria bacterium]